ASRTAGWRASKRTPVGSDVIQYRQVENQPGGLERCLQRVLAGREVRDRLDQIDVDLVRERRLQLHVFILEPRLDGVERLQSGADFTAGEGDAVQVDVDPLDCLADGHGVGVFNRGSQPD